MIRPCCSAPRREALPAARRRALLLRKRCRAKAPSARDPGTPVAVLLLASPIPSESRAAAELTAAPSKMTGRAVTVIDRTSTMPVVVELVTDTSLGPEEYQLQWAAEGERFRIAGGRPRGVLYG